MHVSNHGVGTMALSMCRYLTVCLSLSVYLYVRMYKHVIKDVMYVCTVLVYMQTKIRRKAGARGVTDVSFSFWEEKKHLRPRALGIDMQHWM